MMVLLHTTHATLYDFSVRQHLFAQIDGHRTGPTSVSSTADFHGVMQQRVHQSWVHNTDEVKQRLLNLCHGMDNSTIDNANDEWCKHLHACVQANGLLNSIDSC